MSLPPLDRGAPSWPVAAEVSQSCRDLRLGPLRDKRIVDISAADYENQAGFVPEVSKARDLMHRAFDGDENQTEALQAGGAVQFGGGMVLLRAERASAAVGSVAVGLKEQTSCRSTKTNTHLIARTCINAGRTLSGNRP